MSNKNFCDTENMPASMEELMNNQNGNVQQFKEGEIIKGKVTNKTDKGLYLDINYKSDSFLDRDDISSFDDINVGDVIDVYVEQFEDEDNVPKVSFSKAVIQKTWDNIVNSNQEGGIIHGLIKASVKGGLIVDVGVDAFLPGSQVDVGPVKNLEKFVGLEEDFKILKINAERRNIVLSRREILEEKRNAARDALLATLEKGQIRRGVVKNITEFGAFIDLNGMDGLLHITDMSWGRVTRPDEIVKPGQEIDVMILDVDHVGKRVSLGLKQKDGNPWDTVDVKYPKGSKVKGKVVNVLPYGAFVELEEGIEGLIHVSEMSWTKKVQKASEVVQVGDEVEAEVLEVNKDERKISLGLRQTQGNPWELIKERFPKGTRIKGKVRNMTGYGAFVQIQDDIDGMIHVSDMSWIRKINHPSEVLQKGQEVEAVIVEVNAEQQRISLSMKELNEDPWQSIQTKYKVGDLVEGKVTKLASFGAFVELDGGIDGLIHISELSDERVAKVKDVVQVGSVVKCRIKNINTEEKRIGLSMKDALDNAAPAAADAAPASTPTSTFSDTLGGALDEALKRAQNEDK